MSGLELLVLLRAGVVTLNEERARHELPPIDQPKRSAADWEPPPAYPPENPQPRGAYR